MIEGAQPLSMLVGPAIGGMLVQYDPTLRLAFGQELLGFAAATLVVSFIKIGNPKPDESLQGTRWQRLRAELAAALSFVNERDAAGRAKRPSLKALLALQTTGQARDGCPACVITAC
jgi:hypothetical protein